MSRRRLAMGTLFAAVLVGLDAWVLWPSPPSPVNESNVASIRPGMAHSDVAAILGEPGTRFGSQDDEFVKAYWQQYHDELVVPPGAWIEWWRGDHFGIEVIFEEHGTVLDKHGWAVEQTSLDEMLRSHFRSWVHR
jgi:hypothetical protein